MNEHVLDGTEEEEEVEVPDEVGIVIYLTQQDYHMYTVPLLVTLRPW